MEKICQGCGKKFQCLGNEKCWCNEFTITKTRLEQMKTLDDDCFCEKCISSK